MGRRKPRLVSSQGDLARALGVAQSTACRWIQRGCPRLEDGRFDVDQVADWVRDMRRDAVRSRSSGTHDVPKGDDLGTGRASPRAASREEAEIRFREARAAKTELELEQMRGNLLPREEVASMLVSRAAMFRRAFDALRRRLRARLLGEADPRVFDGIIAEEFDAVLAQAYGGQAGDEGGDVRRPAARGTRGTATA